MVFIHISYHLVINFNDHNTNDYKTNYQILFFVDILVRCQDILLSGNCFTNKFQIQFQINVTLHWDKSEGFFKNIIYDITPVDEFV